MKEQKTIHRRHPTRIIIIFIGVALVAILLAAVLLFLFRPDFFVNGYIKGKIENGFMKSNPGYTLKIGSLHYKFWDDKIETDTIYINKNDTILLSKITGCSVTGIKFKHLIKGGPKDSELAGYVANTKDVYFNLPESEYEIRFKNIHLSASDSLILAEDFEYHPKRNDSAFFAANKFQQTRYKITSHAIHLSGIDYAGMISGKRFHIHTAKLTEASIDIQISRYKPLQMDTAINPMPNESYNTIKNPLHIDSMTIDNGLISYNERFEFGGKLATINLNHVGVSAYEKIDSAKKSVTAMIAANFKVNNVSPMKVSLILPLSSKTFSMKYSGTCGRMDLSSLNHYLDVAEPMRFKSGIIEYAAFDVDITSGYASGNFLAKYSNLKVEPSNLKMSQSKTKRKINTFLANLLQIRNNNLPDKKGNLKAGKVKFMRKHDTAFIDMLWLSLRSGLSDISGINEL